MSNLMTAWLVLIAALAVSDLVRSRSRSRLRPPRHRRDGAHTSSSDHGAWTGSSDSGSSCSGSSNSGWSWGSSDGGGSSWGGSSGSDSGSSGGSSGGSGCS